MKITPLVLQDERTECGLACLAMIAGHYGQGLEMSHIRQLFGSPSRGVSASDISQFGTKLNLVNKILQIDVAELKQITLPAILHWDLDHFVVLKAISGGKYIIHDPARGVLELSKQAFGKSFTGIAIELNPNTNFDNNKKHPTLSLSDLWISAPGTMKMIFGIGIVTLFSHLCSMLAPYYFQLIIDDAVIRDTSNLIWLLAIAFIILSGFRILADSVRDSFVLRLSSVLNARMAESLFTHTLKLPQSFFAKRELGNLVSRFDSLQEVQSFFSTGIISIVINLLFSLLFFLVLSAYSLTIALVVLAFSMTNLLIIVASLGKNRQLNLQTVQSEAKQSGELLESLRSIETVKANQLEGNRFQSWGNTYSLFINNMVKEGRFSIGLNGTRQTISAIENIIVIALAATFVLDSAMTIGMMVALLAYKSQFVSAISSLFESLLELKLLKVHLNRLSDFIFADQEEAYANSPTVGEIRSGVLCKNASFRFDDLSVNVLDNINLAIKPGQSVAVVGPSGCGKSTLLRLIGGLDEATEGSVLLGDTKYSRPPNLCRDYISFVSQGDKLLRGTILGNISGFDPNPDIDLAYKCARTASIFNEIESLPLKWHTEIGELGSGLSGGQIQRICLARALYRRPKILVMDEATSQLDVDNERAIINNLKELEITRIFSAHRASVINSADVVFNLQTKKSKILEKKKLYV